MLSILARIRDKLRHRGAYVDYWTYVHFGSGMLLGLLLVRTRLNLAGALGVATVVFCLWELVEPPLHRIIGQRFPEKMTNQICDILSGLAGCLVGFTFLNPYSLLELLD